MTSGKRLLRHNLNGKMKSEVTQTALVPAAGEYRAALTSALRLWSDSTTAASTEQRQGLLRYKGKVVDDFFAFAGKHPAEVKPGDVRDWRREFFFNVMWNS